MEQYIHWIVGVMLFLISASFKYASDIGEKVDELSKFVYQLPCASTDVEAKLAELEAEVADLSDFVGRPNGGSTSGNSD